MNLIYGEIIDEKGCRTFLKTLGSYIEETLASGFPEAELVISAADVLSRSLSLDDAAQ